MQKHDSSLRTDARCADRLVQAGAILSSIIVFTVYISIFSANKMKNGYLYFAVGIMAILMWGILQSSFLEKTFKYAFVAFVVVQMFFGYFLMVS